MNEIGNLSTALENRLKKLEAARPPKTMALASIEGTSNEVNSSSSIELPQCITKLITGSDYWRLAKTRRYLKLAREGHLETLQALAEQAMAKDAPDHWFARVCSVKMWERTLALVAKTKRVATEAARIAEQLGVTAAEQIQTIYYAAWRKGSTVGRYAAWAAESGRDKFRFFCWLTSKKRGTDFQLGKF